RWGVDQINGRSDILHLKNFHPTDDWYGLAPLEAALLAIDQHNAASQWNMAMLNNGARPSGALVYAPKEGPGTLTEDQVQRLKNELEENYQSSRNTGRPLLLEGGLDWKPLSLSPQEMDWLKGRDMASRDIALAFGVPPQLIGVPDAQTYANYQEARLALYEDTILPLAYRLMGALGAWLTDLFHEELTLTIDADAIAALTARRDTLWEKLRRADFLTLNEKRAALGYSALPEGDQIMPHAADKN
ncbi:MAG: phage portal protein, partial [Alphaproteobacteria bacterium]|nr:phage portal protein [Alphaproteobacteria bacterium]